MEYSDPRAVVYRGKHAQLHVMRNNGYCWGRLVFPDDLNLDVESPRDQYDNDDETALNAFIRAARNPANVRIADGWPLFWNSKRPHDGALRAANRWDLKALTTLRQRLEETGRDVTVTFDDGAAPLTFSPTDLPALRRKIIYCM